MTTLFENEVLTIDGTAWAGTVVVETEVSDASFDHAFGTEKVTDIIHEATLFLADRVDEATRERLNDRARLALAGWLVANERRVARKFEAACKHEGEL